LGTIAGSTTSGTLSYSGAPTQASTITNLQVNALLSSFSVTSFIAPTTQVIEQTYVDPSNGLYANALTSTSQTTCTGTCSTSSTDNTPNLTSEYSETAEYIVTLGAAINNVGGSFNGGIDISAAATPLPATLPLFAGGLGFVGFLAKRRILLADEKVRFA